MVRSLIKKLSFFKKRLPLQNKGTTETVFLYYPGKDPQYFRHVTDLKVPSSDMLARFGTAGRFVYNDTLEIRIATVCVIAVITFVFFLFLIPLIDGVVGRLIISLFSGVVFGFLPGAFLGKKIGTKPALRLLAQVDGMVHPISHPTYIDPGYAEIDIIGHDGSVSKKTVPQNWKASTLHEINQARDSENYYKTKKTSQRKLEMGLLVTLCIISLILLFLFGTANFGIESGIVEQVPSLSDLEIVENQHRALGNID